MKTTTLTVKRLTFAALLAALYVILTLPFAQIPFGIIQFRLAESFAFMAALTPAAVPGLFVGCFLANLLNPQNLGVVDILGGSLATLLAAWLTWMIARKETEYDRITPRYIVSLMPPVIVNALIVGFYLPFLLFPEEVSAKTIFMSMGSIALSQIVVIYAIGLPLMLLFIKQKNLNQMMRSLR